jgi:hypothetical protein
MEPAANLLLAVPAALTLGAPASGAVAVASLIGTATWSIGPNAAGGPWPLLHTAALMVLVALVCRWSRGWPALVVAGLTVLAEAVLGIPITAVPHGSGGGAMGSWWDPIAI